MPSIRLGAIAGLGVLAIGPAAGFGQAMTVIGAGTTARECYSSANFASSVEFVTRGALEACDYALEHATLNSRDRAATYVNRGIIRGALEDYTEAVRDYETALEIRPDFPEIYVNRGNIFFLSFAFERAIEDYTRAMALNLDRMQIAYLNRGMAHEQLGNRDLAEADYRRAVELAPQWALAQNKLDRLLARDGDDGAHTSR